MSYSLYDATVPMAKNALKALTKILKLGEAAPNSASLLDARIYPDMLPLSFQIKMVTDTSTKLVARLHGTEPHAWEGDLNNFADCYARISKAEEILAAADKEVINQRQGEIVSLSMGSKGTFQMTGSNYAAGYALPNIFFHLTTAYNILRKEGVPVGKESYIEPFIGQYLQQ